MLDLNWIAIDNQRDLLLSVVAVAIYWYNNCWTNFSIDQWDVVAEHEKGAGRRMEYIYSFLWMMMI